MFQQLNDIFERRTKQKLAAASLGQVVVAMLDTLAVALVLPLVDLATGASMTSGAVGVVSNLFGNPDRATLTLILTGAVVALFVLKDLGSLAFAWWMTGFNFRERVKVSSRLLEHFLVSPFTTMSRRSTAELVRTMNDSVSQVFNFTVGGLMSLLSSTIAILAIVVALLVVAPVPTLVVVAYFGTAALIYNKVVKPRAARAGEAMNEATVGAWRTAFAALGGIKELHIRGTQEHFVRNYRDMSFKASDAGRVASFLGALPKYILEILFILAVGLIMVLAGAASAGDAGSVVGLLALFVAAGFRVLPSVTGLLSSITSIRVGAAALGLVHTEVLEAKAFQLTPERDGPALPFTDRLVLEQVSFRYPDSDVDVLKSVDLEVPRGSSIAVVGGSGAGKTTLVDVILALHDPTSGTVSVDGTDISQSKRRWQHNIGYVPQDVYMLEGTLAENIAFDKDRADIDETQLWGAIQQAQLESLVGELANGVDTPLGERGTRLSGGQRQRVGIARALYRDPALLVLDEATSALDNETEHRISETIKGLHGDITVIIVAHRLSTVRDADQIVFLKDGRVETTGTFGEVRDANAEFARLVELGSLEPLERAHTEATATA
ncbi:ABC transporter ATP-binding protein [Humibacillus xanthopallidus]|nr:ABC transporter ATP-binding protein [Humibacillus xanthopallidus]